MGTLIAAVLIIGLIIAVVNFIITNIKVILIILGVLVVVCFVLGSILLSNRTISAMYKGKNGDYVSFQLATGESVSLKSNHADSDDFGPNNVNKYGILSHDGATCNGFSVISDQQAAKRRFDFDKGRYYEEEDFKEIFSRYIWLWYPLIVIFLIRFGWFASLMPLLHVGINVLRVITWREWKFLPIAVCCGADLLILSGLAAYGLNFSGIILCATLVGFIILSIIKAVNR